MGVQSLHEEEIETWTIIFFFYKQHTDHYLFTIYMQFYIEKLYYSKLGTRDTLLGTKESHLFSDNEEQK